MHFQISNDHCLNPYFIHSWQLIFSFYHAFFSFLFSWSSPAKNGFSLPVLGYSEAQEIQWSGQTLDSLLQQMVLRPLSQSLAHLISPTAVVDGHMHTEACLVSPTPKHTPWSSVLPHGFSKASEEYRSSTEQRDETLETIHSLQGRRWKPVDKCPSLPAGRHSVHFSRVSFPYGNLSKVP